MGSQFHIFVIVLGLPLGFSVQFIKLNQGVSDTFAEIPCSRDKLIFPSNFDAVVELPGKVSTTGLILPTDGALILPYNSDLQILAEDDKRCQGQNGATLQVTQSRHFSWFDGNSWTSLLHTNSKIIPDVEMVPCDHANIKMSVKEPISIDLENVQSLSVGSINVDDRDLGASDFQNFLQTELGQIMFKSVEGTTVRSGSESDCGCAGNVMREFWTCFVKADSCPVPKCLKPIVPLGYCCAVCGAALKIYVNECKYVDMDVYGQFEGLVEKMKLGNNILMHGSFFEEGDDKFYQLVAMDSADYNEDSVRVMKEFISRNLTSHKHNVLYSGKSYAPNSGLNFWAIVFSAFLAVVGFFVILYAYYERNLLSLVSLPTVNRHRVFHTPFGFARFDNHPANDMEVPGNVVVGLGQDNEGIRVRGAREQPATGTTTSFHNPMFTEKEMKSTEAVLSSSANVEKDYAVKDDPEAELDIPECRVKAIKNNDDCEDEERLVEVDLNSEGSSE